MSPQDLLRCCFWQEYRWKVGAKLHTGPGLRVKLQRKFTLPNILGLGWSLSCNSGLVTVVRAFLAHVQSGVYWKPP